jgi:hypothetical protein
MLLLQNKVLYLTILWWSYQCYTRLGIFWLARRVYCRSQWRCGLRRRPLDCWDCGFEFRQGHGCSSLVSVVCCARRTDHSYRCASETVGGPETSTMKRRSPELRLGSAWKKVFSLEDSWSKFINSYKELCIHYFLLRRFFFLLLQNSTLLTNNPDLSGAATNSQSTSRTRITAPTASSQPHFISSDCEWRRWLPDMKCTWKRSKSHISQNKRSKGKPGNVQACSICMVIYTVLKISVK